jgi:S1-C subfamily serine protease
VTSRLRICLLSVAVSCCLYSQPTAAVQDSNVETVLQQQQATVVKLFGAGLGNLDSYGSGTLISEEGHVLTIWNHLINTGFLTAVTSDGKRYSVDVVGTSRDFDIAVLKLNTNGPTEFPFVDLTQSVAASSGQSVFAFSNMFHVAAGAEPVSVVHGVIAQNISIDAGLGRWSLPVKSPVYIVDAVINNSGAGGGLLTTTDGQPIGLIGREIQFTSSGTWINYAVPLTDLRPVVEALLSGRTVDPKLASKQPTPISDRQLTAKYGLTLLPVVVDRTPCYVDNVVAGSVAAGADLRRGDLIVLLDDDVVVSVSDFRQKLASRRPGQRISITVQRDQQLVSVTLRVP